MERLRPYLAVFAARFLQMLQYRTAALAGVTTQLWWGAVRVAILAAFYTGSAKAGAGAPITLSQAITYTWLGQGLLALLPWNADPVIAAAVRTGSVSYDRLRPMDTYGLWFAGTLGWSAARALPRVLLMALIAALLFPLVGLGRWAWQPPATVDAALLFALSLALAVLLSTALTMVINIVVVATLDARGANLLMMPLATVFTGSLLPLSLYPDGARLALLAQPFAGVLDIPNRIYFGALSGPTAAAGIGLQVFWILAIVTLGHLWLGRTMRRLQVQGG